jgi:hypothetical protein
VRFRLPLALLGLFGLAAPARAQSPPPGPQGPVTRADREFDLNIPERKITERDYRASSAVQIGEPASAVFLRIGGEVTARQVTLLLRNVRGHVRFRASLEPIVRRIRNHRQEKE